MEPNPWLRWIECHPGLAGYVQAVGVIATVALAVFGPPLILFFNRARDWWITRLDAIHFARTARANVRAVIQQIDALLDNLAKFAPQLPWRGGFGEMMIQIQPPLGLPQYGDLGHRLLFLQRFKEQAVGYNSWLLGLIQKTNSADELNTQREQIKTVLADLRSSAVQACTTIDAMKIYPWSRRAKERSELDNQAR